MRVFGKLVTLALIFALSACATTGGGDSGEPKSVISLGERPSSTFYLSNDFGRVSHNQVQKYLANQLHRFSDMPPRTRSSYGCIRWAESKCIHYDRDLQKKYNGVSFWGLNNGNIAIQYEESKEGTLVSVPIEVSTQPGRGDNPTTVTISFPTEAKIKSDSGLSALFNLAKSEVAPLGTKKELAADIQQVFSGLISFLQSGTALLPKPYTIQGETKSQYSTDAVRGNFIRLASKQSTQGNKETYVIDPGKLGSVGSSFTAYVSLLPYRDGAVLKYEIPVQAALDFSGNSTPDPSADQRQKLLLGIVND